MLSKSLFLLRVLLTLEGGEGIFQDYQELAFLYRLLSINNKHNTQISQQYNIKYTLIAEYLPAVKCSVLELEMRQEVYI